MTEGIRVLVCGGREFDNWTAVTKALTALDVKHGIACVIEGGARGADFLGAKWARANRKPSMKFEAHWHSLGKKAGHLRNGWMLQFGEPDVVVAFPGGAGTANMIGQAEAAGVRVWQPLLARIEARSGETERLDGEATKAGSAPN